MRGSGSDVQEKDWIPGQAGNDNDLGSGVLEMGDPRVNHPKSSLRSLLRTPEPEDDCDEGMTTMWGRV